MEVYKDSMIKPPFTNLLPLAMNEKTSSSRKRATNEAAETGESLLKQRERREKMSDMYNQLQSLIPSLKGIHKATKEEIVTDAISHIKFLEEEKERLENLKDSMLQESISSGKQILAQCTNKNSSVHATASSNGVAFFGIQLPNKASLMTKVFRVFEKHHSEVLAASICVNEQQLLTLTATVLIHGDNGAADAIDKIKREILIL